MTGFMLGFVAGAVISVALAAWFTRTYVDPVLVKLYDQLQAAITEQRALAEQTREGRDL